MRMLLTVQMDTEKSNKLIEDDKLTEFMQEAVGRLRPEAAYFGAQEGQRTGFIVFDLNEVSDIPSIAEPFFSQLGAKISFIPVMNLDDVRGGLAKAAQGS
ncbi:DUF3303 family protein [Kitasatospora herbaricolor]|uniref:Muconolactone isomerase domain-containing protein n=1 Tax=Kitasatospora herbaricolor TaxID=68217 RepID=A0ABZ1W275_9ACTN|nr:hypothetical protein [Kitasatospora herbaricolor]